MAVILLRLRVACQQRTKTGLLSATAVVSALGDPAGPALAEEWLALTPRVDAVMKVHEAASFSIPAMGEYAARLTTPRRTVLWIALEKAGAVAGYLRIVGRKGVTGSAIAHMYPTITGAPTQALRNKATDRLLVATFAEEPSQAEKDRGETAGHKEATKLELALADSGVLDNTVLAARIVIHSGGVAHGAITKLRTTFTKFAHGKQARTFTRDQAQALKALGLLEPKKRGRMAWLFGS